MPELRGNGRQGGERPALPPAAWGPRAVGASTKLLRLSAREQRLWLQQQDLSAALQRVVRQHEKKMTAMECESLSGICSLRGAKCVRNEPTCSAERLCKSMKGLGTDDSSLIGVIVPCSEIDVLDIRREFLTTYGKSLYSFMKMASAGPVVHELPSLGNSPVWLEGKRQELNVKTTQLSARNDLILESVFDVLQENEIHGLKREVPLLMQRGHLRVTVGKAGRTAGFLHSFPPQSLPRCSCSPIFLLATAGLSWGHVVIRLLEKIWPTAFTVWHISKKVSPSREVSSAPKEFAVLLA
ncbi:uncharacterized protein LOC104910080 isoform X2 [Meleagris gallopavo]|uniref:uncharacterized protein LOC104910080 isoform X2 n=1 Tax=Meleagris gallopavo TaxID=9103 RepID=UPI0005499C18|nr:uncharacterized protein LOC104910080 isoform X2 [Meleagris gallopavo]